MTKVESILSFSAVFLVVFVMLFAPAFASGEPSADMNAMSSGEPFGEFSGIAVVTDILFEAAGIETETDVSALLADMDTEAIAAELRTLLDMTQLMTDEQLRAQITALAAAYGYSFTDAELDAIVRIIRSFEPFATAELQVKLEQMRGSVLAVEEVRDSLETLGDRLQDLLQKIVALFRSIFRKGGLEGLLA